MTPQEALNLLFQVAYSKPLPGADHEKVKEAALTVQNALRTPKPEEDLALDKPSVEDEPAD
jgi:hypothetical protein